MEKYIIGIINEFYSNNALKLNKDEMYIPIMDAILKFDFERKIMLIKTNNKNYECRIADFVSTLIELY